jgi:ANTAR domain
MEQADRIDRTTEGESEAITKAVAEITERRGVIEQAKGVLMVVYNIDADAAFELLKWRSRQTNAKLRALAEKLISDFPSLQWGHDSLRSKFGQLFMEAGARVPHAKRPDPAQRHYLSSLQPRRPKNGHRSYHAISRVGGGPISAQKIARKSVGIRVPGRS